MSKFIPLQGHTVSHLAEFCRNAFNSMNNLTLGGVGQAGNLSGAHVTTTAVLAATDYAVQHDLLRIPNGYLVTGTNKAAHIYTGVTAWTKNKIYLQSDTANTEFTVFVF